MTNNLTLDDQIEDDVNDDLDDDDEPEAPVDELTLLKQRAKVMGLKVSPNIGLEALRKKVRDALEGVKEEPEVVAAPEAPVAMEAPTAAPAPALNSRAAIRRQLLKDEMKLVRLRITNMNPHKKELNGEIFTVANSFLGVVRKYIPYGEVTDNGWHVPHCIYTQMKERKFLQIRVRKNPKNPNQPIIDQRWVPEFALEVLPTLTEHELAELKAHQMAAGGQED